MPSNWHLQSVQFLSVLKWRYNILHLTELHSLVIHSTLVRCAECGILHEHFYEPYCRAANILFKTAFFSPPLL